MSVAMAYFWIFSTKLLRRSGGWIVALLRAVDSRNPSGRGKRDAHNVEAAKAEAVAIHREATPNDEIG